MALELSSRERVAAQTHAPEGRAHDPADQPRLGSQLPPQAYARESRSPTRTVSPEHGHDTPPAGRLPGCNGKNTSATAPGWSTRTATQVEPGSSHHLKSEYPPQVKHLTQPTRTSTSLRDIGLGTRSSTDHRDIPGAEGWNVTCGPGRSGLTGPR